MVFSTSRGRDLHLYLRPKTEAVVFHKSGGEIEEIKEEAIQKIKYYKKKYLTIHAYFLVGIPDITHREKGSGYEEVSVVDDTNDLVDKIKKKLLKLADEIKETGCRVCICTVPPMDLERWNLHRLEKKENKKFTSQRKLSHNAKETWRYNYWYQ